MSRICSYLFQRTRCLIWKRWKGEPYFEVERTLDFARLYSLKCRLHYLTVLNKTVKLSETYFYFLIGVVGMGENFMRLCKLSTLWTGRYWTLLFTECCVDQTALTSPGSPWEVQNFRSYPRAVHWIRICTSVRSLGDLYAHYNLRTTLLCIYWVCCENYYSKEIKLWKPKLFVAYNLIIFRGKRLKINQPRAKEKIVWAKNSFWKNLKI